MFENRLIRLAVALAGVIAMASAVAWLGASGTAAPAIVLPTVKCQGNSRGGSGPRNFTYEVSAGVTEVYTGLHNASTTLSNVLKPSGWQHEIVSTSATHDPSFVAHGSPATEAGNCGAFIRWWGSAPANDFHVGFDTVNEPEIHETAWVVTGSTAAHFGRNVGNGLGPTHTPDNRRSDPGESRYVRPSRSS